jgi:hypothetical protein
MDLRYSEAELLKFFDYVANKGLMKPATARARKAAAQKVLSVLETAEKTDVRTLDRNLIYQRFENKFAQQFHPDSLTTYRQRFNTALDEFIEYVNNPAGFRPSMAQRKRVDSNGERVNAKPGTQRARRHEPQPPDNAVDTPRGLYAFPVPLPSGVVAQLYLPTAITDADANRIAAVVKALAVNQGGDKDQ